MKKQILFFILLVIPLCSFAPKAIEYYFVYSPNKYNAAYLEKKEYIRQIMNTISWQESRGKNHLVGSSGERGEFQIMPGTWKAWCKQYFGKWKPMTRENQYIIVELVITSWVMKGFTLKQIAAKWNCGTHIGWEKKIGINSFGAHYDVPAYVSHFVQQYQKIKKYSEVNYNTYASL